jgi:hypothetical protein
MIKMFAPSDVIIVLSVGDLDFVEQLYGCFDCAIWGEDGQWTLNITESCIPAGKPFTMVNMFKEIKISTRSTGAVEFRCKLR